MDINGSLIVGCCGEYLALLGRNCGVPLDELGGYSAQSLYGQGQRSYIQQQYIVNFSGQYAGLDSCSDGYTLIRVNTLERLFAGNFLYGFLNCRDSCGTAYQDHLGDVCVGNAGVSHGFLHRLYGPLYQVFGQLIKFGSRQIHIHVERTLCRNRDERQVDVGCL